MDVQTLGHNSPDTLEVHAQNQEKMRPLWLNSSWISVSYHFINTLPCALRLPTLLTFEKCRKNVAHFHRSIISFLASETCANMWWDSLNCSVRVLVQSRSLALTGSYPKKTNRVVVPLECSLKVTCPSMPTSKSRVGPRSYLVAESGPLPKVIDCWAGRFTKLYGVQPYPKTERPTYSRD